MKTLQALFLIVPVALFLLFYLATVCAVPVRWPYYEPVLEDAYLDDPGDHLFLPRANLSPRATLQLLPQLSFRTRMGCYPMAGDGSQTCSFQLRFFNNSDLNITFAEQPVSVRSVNGEALIDQRFYELVSDRLPKQPTPEFRSDGIFISYTGRLSILLKRAVMPDRVVAKLPDLLVDGVLVPMPAIEFVRRENITCTGLITNY